MTLVKPSNRPAGSDSSRLAERAIRWRAVLVLKKPAGSSATPVEYILKLVSPVRPSSRPSGRVLSPLLYARVR